jgi:hypothetical protein
MSGTTETPREIAQRLEKTMPCNCDLDNWEPLPTTKHSSVCRIHSAALQEWRYRNHLGDSMPAHMKEAQHGVE